MNTKSGVIAIAAVVAIAVAAYLTLYILVRNNVEPLHRGDYSITETAAPPGYTVEHGGATSENAKEVTP